MMVTTCFLVSGCSTTLEHARMEIAEDVSSTAQLLMSHETTSGSSSELRRFEEMAKECGASTRIFGGGSVERFYLQINFSAKTRDELDVALQCASTKDDRFPTLTIKTFDGILGKKYVVEFHQIIPFELFKGDGAAKEFVFTMPGDITDFVDHSSSSIAWTTAEMVGENRIRIRVNHVTETELEAALRRRCPDLNCIDEDAVVQEVFGMNLKFILTAKKSKMDLQSAIAIAGIFLGSGILYELARRYAARKKTIA